MLKQPFNKEQQDVFNKALVKLEADFEARLTELETRALPRTAEIALGGNQTSNLSNGMHIEFDLISGSLADAGLVSLATGSGQADGVVTLQPGTYKIDVDISAFFNSSSGYTEARLELSSGANFDTDTGEIPRVLLLESDSSLDRSDSDFSSVIKTVTSAISIVVANVVAPTNMNRWYRGCRLIITEVR